MFFVKFWFSDATIYVDECGNCSMGLSYRDLNIFAIFFTCRCHDISYHIDILMVFVKFWFSDDTIYVDELGNHLKGLSYRDLNIYVIFYSQMPRYRRVCGVQPLLSEVPEHHRILPLLLCHGLQNPTWQGHLQGGGSQSSDCVRHNSGYQTGIIITIM